MVLAIAFAHVWGVIQLLVLASFARTARVRTVLAALAVGLYAIGPLTVLLQLGWIHLAASLTGTTVAHMQSLASYTVDPFLEEALKLVPLGLLLLLVPAIRRQWLLTDYVLIAAATGSGYGLAENMYRYAGSPGIAHAIAGGWAMDIGSVTVLVPGVWRTLTSWLPPGTSFVGDTIVVNSHLVWSALGGLALGLIVRYRTTAARVAAGALFLYIGLDHASWNASLVPGSWLSFLTKPLIALAAWGGVLAIAAVVAAWWLDRTRQPSGAALEPLLAAERSAGTRIAGTLKAAISRLPWSISWVGGFVRARRAYHVARAPAPEGPDTLLEALVAERDRIDGALTAAESPPFFPKGLTLSAVKSALRRPPVIISLVLLAPSILFLVLGGFPQTAWIQRLMAGAVAWPLVVIITTLSLARVAWSVIGGVRNWSATRRLPSGDDAAIIGLQLACGIGSVGLGGFAVMRVLGGLSAGSNLIGSAHGADAANRLKLPGGISLSNSAGSVVPPRPGQTLPGEAAPPNTKSPSAGDSSDAAPSPKPQAPSPPQPKAPPSTPKGPVPPSAPKPDAYDEGVAYTESDAVTAEADALEAQQRYKQAVDAWDAAERDKNSGTDPELDAARERTRKAVEAAEAADPADRDMLQAEVDAAKAAEQKVVNDRWDRKTAEEAAAKDAAGNAENAMNAANAKAAEERELANSVKEARDRHADPLGTAADIAEKNYAAAQAKEWEAFQDPKSDYPAARKAATLAREQAEEARAAANAAKDARSASVIGVDKP